ncbi:hypothetical protein [Malaciobacter marinus]|uniref:hypothetical protein n=1 Tax=Malaciobacter marinus TaxID=505249 RepID=UPI0009A7A0B9|nr:hypothetical protein [Malaciobacter marinus]SKB79875.1 hypothetical protein SAMN06295997_1464 [Malaciobacter marinus]
MNIYENIYLGTFIYKLGIETQKSGLVNDSSVNLFQQTPSDETLSDLITGINGKYLIIEFKKDKEDKKEIVKYNRLNDKIISSSPEMEEISNQCHYLGVGKDNDINFYNYIDYFENSSSKKNTNFIKNYLDLNKNNDEQIGIKSANNFVKYLRFLQKTHKSNRSYSTSGLIVAQNGKGQIGLVGAENIESLIKTLDLSLNKNKDLDFVFGNENSYNYNEDIDISPGGW